MTEISIEADAGAGVLPCVARAVELAGFADRVESVLVIGMGGGMGMLMRQWYPLAWIDLVETDPVVVEASVLFGFRTDGRMRVIIDDAVAVVASSVVRYDVIFLDAYSGLDVPDQLLTREFFDGVRRLLVPGGVVISNVLSRDANPSFLREVEGLATDLYVEVVPVDGAGHNCLVVASDRLKFGGSDGAAVGGGGCSV